MRRRKFELLIADIRRHLLSPPTHERYENLSQSSWDLRNFNDQVASDVGKARELIAVAHTARLAAGPGCAVAEEALLRCLEKVVSDCGKQIVGEDLAPLPNRQALADVEADQRPFAEVVGEVADYALDCLHFQPRPRDAFAGARRGLAFNILGQVSQICELPIAMDRACEALRLVRPKEVHGAINFLHDFFDARPDDPLSDDLAEALLHVVEKTKSRSTAVGALHLLVKTLVISEWEASDRIREWKG
ncbi:MAG: hypothetical protein FJ395_00505 [Verrucomicrobia bacterium]|nr:hypothetical protein [Verrucomicrobiota bacterium]